MLDGDCFILQLGRIVDLTDVMPERVVQMVDMLRGRSGYHGFVCLDLNDCYFRYEFNGCDLKLTPGRFYLVSKSDDLYMRMFRKDLILFKMKIDCLPFIKNLEKLFTQ
jgi:hypothetical protein